MSYKTPSHKLHKVMVQPINVIFRQLQNRTRTSIWLNDNTALKIEGVVVGFDEFMNLVLDKADEVYLKSGKEIKRKYIGRIMLKGDSIALMQPLREKDSY